MPVVIPVLSLAWLFWPIEGYEVVGRTRGYVITLSGSSEVTPRSIIVTPYQEPPWITRKRLEELALQAPKVTTVAQLGERAYWVWDTAESNPPLGTLRWVRGSIAFTLRVRGKLEGHEAGSREWINTCQSYARDLDARVLEGEVGSKEFRRTWTPRVLLWREQLAKRIPWSNP